MNLLFIKQRLNKTNTNLKTLHKIRTDRMNAEENSAVQNLVRECADIFHTDGNQLTFSNQVKHNIRTKDKVPTQNLINIPMYIKGK